MQIGNVVRILVVAMVLVVGALGPVGAADQHHLSAIPFVFIGKADDCGAGTFGSHIVTSAWLGGMGLPDSGGDTALNGVLDTANDPHHGLLLSKNGPSTDCSSAGARITGVRGLSVDATFTLGFDYRNGGHCGAGAPRFNVVAKPATGPNTSHFVGGCANGVQTAAPQDPAQWTRARFTPAQQFPSIPPGSRIVSITLIYDEGTDTASDQDLNGVGLAVVDNIFINGQFIRTGTGVADGASGEAGRGNGDNDD